MTILAWVLVGLIAGVLANIIFPGPAKGGWLGAMVLGVVGAVIGGFAAGMLTGEDWTTGLNVSTIAISVVGALLALFVYHAVAGIRRTV